MLPDGTFIRQVLKPYYSVNKPSEHKPNENTTIPSQTFDIPSLLSDAKETRIKLYRLRSHYHSQLFYAITDEERYELALSIHDLHPQIREANSIFDQLSKGDVPSEIIKSSMSANQFKLQRNYKYYISRYLKKIKNSSDAQQSAIWQQKIEEYERKLEDLNGSTS